MLPGAPPFVEAEEVLTVRRVAARLAASTLPILVAGALGTGRRTLATALGALRDRSPVVCSAFDGIETVRAQRGAACVVVHNLHVLDTRAQNELATLVRDRSLRLVATMDAGHTLGTDLAALTAVTRVELPPVRDRGADVVLWATFFLGQAATTLGRTALRFTPDAEKALVAQAWPGNLAELFTVVQRAAVLCGTGDVGAGDLGVADVLTLVGGVQPLAEAVEAFRLEYVARVLGHFGGNRTQTARALGIDPRTIFRYLAKNKAG